MHQHSIVHRALVTYADAGTGEIRVKIPAVTGQSEITISYIGRSNSSGNWIVPSVGQQIIVSSDDPVLSNVFWLKTDEYIPPVEPVYLSLDDLTDTMVLSPVAGDLLSYNGSGWRNSTTPAFVARMTASTFTPSTGTIIYSNAQLNTGNCYNTSTGRFTAPVSGLYSFTHILSARNTTSASYEVAIGRNGLDATRIFHAGGGQQHHAISHHLMSLSAGDYIYGSCYNPSSVVFSGSSDIYYDSGRNLVSGFMGHLVR